MTTNQENSRALSLERLMELVDVYGANLARFPAAERDAAESLLKRSEPAQKAFAKAKALDDLLGEAEAFAPSDVLLDALTKIPEKTPQKGVIVQLMPRKSRALSSFAAAAALLLGVVSGVQLADNETGFVMTGQSDEPSEQSVALTFSELSELALGNELMSDLGYFEGDFE